MDYMSGQSTEFDPMCEICKKDPADCTCYDQDGNLKSPYFPDFSLIINPFSYKPPWTKKSMSVFFKIEWKNNRLSISGVEGPLPSGNCRGACGQIDMQIDNEYLSHCQFNEGWSPIIFKEFLSIWKEYHLNDMKAGCQHQRAMGWGTNELNLIHVSTNVWGMPKATREMYQWVERGGIPEHCYVYMLVRRCLSAALQGKIYEPQNDTEKSWFDTGIITIKTEKKTDGWVRPNEHPEGKLGKPCPKCGFEYGTKWQYMPVPLDILKRLAGLPPTKTKPAWV